MLTNFSKVKLEKAAVLFGLHICVIDAGQYFERKIPIRVVNAVEFVYDRFNLSHFVEQGMANNLLVVEYPVAQIKVGYVANDAKTLDIFAKQSVWNDCFDDVFELDIVVADLDGQIFYL